MVNYKVCTGIFYIEKCALCLQEKFDKNFPVWMTEKYFCLYFFSSLNISDFNLFLCENYNPHWKLFENLVGGSLVGSYSLLPKILTFRSSLRFVFLIKIVYNQFLLLKDYRIWYWIRSFVWIIPTNLESVIFD